MGLRGAEALADADFVAAFCEARQVDCKVVRVEVKKFAASNGLSLEDAARSCAIKHCCNAHASSRRIF